MLNQTILMGRLTRDPETRYIQGSNSSVTRFTVAVDRDYKASNEDKPKTDFISCVAWNKTGEFIEKYFRKGSMIAVIGSIETGSYKDKDGKTVYTTEIRVTKVSFTGEKKAASDSSNNNNEYETDENGFMNIPDGIDEELPFN